MAARLFSALDRDAFDQPGDVWLFPKEKMDLKAVNSRYLRYKLLKPFKSWHNKYLKNKTRQEARQLKLYETTLQEISDYTKEPLDVVRQKHHLGPGGEKGYDIFLNGNVPAKASVEEFYKNCGYYLYELPLWNAEANRPKYLSLIVLDCLKENNYKDVLDYGAGAGDLCIELAKHSLQVTYCDIAHRLFDFAKWRFKRRDLAVSMVQDLKETKDKQFDCIFSFDAFEHIKDFPSALKEIIEHIRIGGMLIFSGAFSGGKLHLTENERYNDFPELNYLLEKMGLSFYDRFAQYNFYKKEKSNVP